MTAPIGEPRATELRPEPRTAGGRLRRRRFVPPNVGRMKVALPNGLTLGNLFFGINAIIAASRGNFNHACLFVVLGGVCDAFDGAAARATRTGGRFGEELDSLVDAISFGLAPAMIVHFSTLANGNGGWNVAVFVFAACAVMRLARFNVTQAGASKTYFQGLPSPAAGGTLATYWWFSQTSFYQNNAAIVDLPWNLVMQGLMLALGFLMVSDVPYPAWPKIGLRSWKGMLGLAGMLFIVFGVSYWRSAFFFPFGIGYVVYGLLRAAFLGMWERRPGRDAYTGAPILGRRGTRSASILPPDAELLDESDLLDPDDLTDDDEYDFFEDEEAPAPVARSATSPARVERPERGTASERMDRQDRLERKKKRKKRERGDRPDRPERQDVDERPEAEAPGERAPRVERPPRPERSDRGPRPDRADRPDRSSRPGLAIAPDAGLLPGDAGGADEGIDEADDDAAGGDALGPRDGAPRKRRKRRRGNRPLAGGVEGPTTMDVAPGERTPGERAPVVPPFIPPPPFPSAPSTSSAPDAAPRTPDPREDRSE
jgi:CDP-diacylglycerol--serine O-phosphatidyltransferase